jgi:radical SAM enzyme (TIGR01210 family)
VSPSAADRRIRELRPAKRAVDPFAAHGSLVEEERRPNGTHERALTIFLAGAECPFTCSFCDLWQWTIDGPTPAGALVRQVERVLNTRGGPMPDRVKLYNASNFFDTRAVPAEDLTRLPELLEPFSGVTVESHVNTIGSRSIQFAEALSGRLEIAIGLETIHPIALAHLNKRLDLARFNRAARLLTDAGIDLRVFVLLGAPYVPAEAAVEWTVRTVEYAVERGAAVVSIIPVRGGNGELERLESLGHFTRPTLAQLETAVDRCVGFRPSVVTADVWDASLLPGCTDCQTRRIERLRQMNVSGCLEPPIPCQTCRA